MEEWSVNRWNTKKMKILKAMLKKNNKTQVREIKSLRERLALNQRKYISSDVRMGRFIFKLVDAKIGSGSRSCLTTSDFFHEETKICLRRGQECQTPCNAWNNPNSLKKQTRVASLKVQSLGIYKVYKVIADFKIMLRHYVPSSLIHPQV